MYFSYYYASMNQKQKNAFVLMIIATIFRLILGYVLLYHFGSWLLPGWGFWIYLLPLIILCYSIPMIIHYFKTSSHYGEAPVGGIFIFCTFLFVSISAAILMISDIAMI